MEMYDCVLCEKSFIGYGNNPAPLNTSDGAKCCDGCNVTKVIPARLDPYFETLQAVQKGMDKTNEHLQEARECAYDIVTDLRRKQFKRWTDEQIDVFVRVLASELDIKNRIS